MMTSIMAWRPELSIATCVLALDMTRPDSYTVDTAPTPDTVTAFVNRASGVSWTEVTAPPDLALLNGQPCLKGNGTTKFIGSTEAAVVAAMAGTDKAVTCIMVLADPTPDAITVFFGGAAAAIQTNRTLTFFSSNAGNGRWSTSRIDDAAATASAPRSVDFAANVTQVVAWTIPGTTASIHVNNETTADPNAAAFDVGATTVTRAAFLVRYDLTPDLFADGSIGAAYLFSSAISASDRIRSVSRLMLRHGVWP